MFSVDICYNKEKNKAISFFKLSKEVQASGDRIKGIGLLGQSGPFSPVSTEGGSGQTERWWGHTGGAEPSAWSGENPHWGGRIPLPLPLRPPRPPPARPSGALSTDVVHLEEDLEFVHGVAVDEQGQRLQQLLEGDGATSVGVKQGEECLGKEGLWPEKGGRWAQCGRGARALKACRVCAHALWGGGASCRPPVLAHRV